MHVAHTGFKNTYILAVKKRDLHPIDPSWKFSLTSHVLRYGLNSHCFPIMLGDGHQPDSVGFYIPTYNKVGWVDHPQVFQGAIWIQPCNPHVRLPVLRNKKHKKSRCRKVSTRRFRFTWGVRRSVRSEGVGLVKHVGTTVVIVGGAMWNLIVKIVFFQLGWKMRVLLVILCGDSFVVYVTGRFHLLIYHKFEAQM